jgi:hypothetical protein
MNQATFHVGRSAAFFALLVTALSLRGADITWINGAGGDWNTAANWSPGQVPGPADKAILALGVTVSVNVNTAVSNVDLSSGALSGAGTLTVSGTLNWTGGAMGGSGSIVISNGAALAISGNSDKTFSQRTINNAGTLSWSGTGNLNSGNAATINNQVGGLFDLQSDQAWIYNQGGNLPMLNNAGTFRKSGGTGTSTLQATATNSGTLALLSGTVTMGGSGLFCALTSKIQGTGTLNISQTAFTPGGVLDPGNPLGALTIIRDFPFTTNCTLNVEIGGTHGGIDYDQLIVAGNASLDGSLEVTLVNGFQPVAGQTFEIIKGTALTNTFSHIAGLDLGGGLYLNPVFSSTNLVLATMDTRPPPQWSSPRKLPGGSIDWTVTQVAGRTFLIQATTNFVDWEVVLTRTNSGAIYDFITSDPLVYPYRFYEALFP